MVEFTLIYLPKKPVKAQELTDFLADHSMVEVAGNVPIEIPMYYASQS